MSTLSSGRTSHRTGPLVFAAGVVLSLLGLSVWIVLLPPGIMMLLLGTVLVVLDALGDLSA